MDGIQEVVEVVEQDRGLGTAYERWCFHQRLARWAQQYEVESALEGPVDGMAGVRGVHCVGLARSGVSVTSVVRGAASADIARGVYARSAPPGTFEVRVMPDETSVGSLPPSDLVLIYHALPFVGEWRPYLALLGGLARKALIVVTGNPDRFGLSAARWLGGAKPPDVWRLGMLAPELWRLGRVREHAYFDAPAWPDLYAGLGQTFKKALKPFFGAETAARFEPLSPNGTTARKFVYGTDRWPYFGGDGWQEELEPALHRRPSFETASERVLRRLARSHAFVVDMRPRSPQERRRRLHLQSGAGGSPAGETLNESG